MLDSTAAEAKEMLDISAGTGKTSGTSGRFSEHLAGGNTPCWHFSSEGMGRFRGNTPCWQLSAHHRCRAVALVFWQNQYLQFSALQPSGKKSAVPADSAALRPILFNRRNGIPEVRPTARRRRPFGARRGFIGPPGL